MAYDKKKMADFAARWQGKGYEKGETQQFWLQLLKALDYSHADDVIFEHHLPSGGFIDVWIRDANVLIEQKSYGIDLDKPEPRQGVMKTPLVQALDYVDELPRPEQPRYVVTCNFGTFRVYDRDQYNKSQLADNAFEFTLEELAGHPEYMDFIVDPKNSRLEKEKQVSIQAGELIGKLYDMMREGYIDPDAEASMHALNVLCVRLVFCLYCEDADLFEKDSFLHYLKDVPAGQFRTALKRLFKALDTDIPGRDPYDIDIKNFPYVNGGLFHEEIEVPNFTEEAKRFLLEEVAAPVNWSQISPTIFGGIFESTLNPDTRRKGGMHYTSPENIHKVIDPLFLDDLKAEFAAIKNAEGITPRKRKNALTRFHAKLCGLKFFDPACGSGNFLTETYICLRKLEDAVLGELRQGQTGFGFIEEEAMGNRVSLNQFYGIEINDFAVKVAESALWISRLKANGETSMFYEGGGDDFPLNEAATIVEGNALRMNWNDVLLAYDCSYIMGNPPFRGANGQTKEQKSEVQQIFAGHHNSSLIDYVACWYKIAFNYIKNTNTKCAFVSTNSVSQGEQVDSIWKPLFEEGFQINFAHTTFRWKNETDEQAHVFVVIIGFSCEVKSETKVLYSYITPDSMPEIRETDNINAYLIDAPNVFIERRSVPLNKNVPKMTKGCQPTDGGNLIIEPDELDEFLLKQPDAKPYIKQLIGAKEFIQRRPRYCLWLVDVDDAIINSMPLVRKRVEKVRNFRLASSQKGTRKLAERPSTFRETYNPHSCLIVPMTSSERRRYIPLGFIDEKTISTNLNLIVQNADLYIFGVLHSQFHNAWMRVVAGRLESRYRYSAGVVYNNFIWPDPSEEQRKAIETCAQAVLDARDNHPDASLAKLYDPDLMPADLLAAHQALDRAVEAAYGVDFGGDEEKIVAHLFKLYAKKTKEK